MAFESFITPRFELKIELNERVGSIILKDNYSEVEFADYLYRYSALVELQGSVMELEGLWNPEITEKEPDRGGKIVTISGNLGNIPNSPTINIRHRFYIPEDGDFCEEQIILQNLDEAELVMKGYRFGFRKKLACPVQYGGPGIDIEKYRLIALPFRLQPDGKKHDYTLNEIFNGWYECSEFYNPMRTRQEVVDCGRGRSEGWAWTDGENGLLILKYNPNAVEYSMIETETDLNFGGASPSLYDEPFEARRLKNGQPISFGMSHYHFYEGRWRRGSYIFREFLSGLGHGLPDSYSTGLFWYARLGCESAGDGKCSIDALESEASRAAELGCQEIYLDSSWESCIGSDLWDTERIGDVAALISHFREEYGLSVGLKSSGRCYCDAYPGLYRRNSHGDIGYHSPYQPVPFYEPCFSGLDYQQEKIRRLTRIVEAGTSFIAFDAYDWRGRCFDDEHGHSVPTSPSIHSASVVDIIRKLREKFPNLTIAASDMIWPWGVRYLPIYQLHDEKGFCEIMAFGFGYESYEALISGKALSLFYYNLGYSIPLFGWVDMDTDNDNCLAFWCYASTIRHFGIGGRATNPEKLNVYRKAIAQYIELKELYTLGEFYGLDELTHIHVLPEKGLGVVNIYNLTDMPITREIEIRPSDLGLFGELEVEGAVYTHIGGTLMLELDIPPQCPVIVKLKEK